MPESEKLASASLLIAMAAIMGEVQAVQKRGKNEFHCYDYATAADIMHELKPLLAKHGLLIFQTETERQFTEGGLALMVTYQFTLAHVSGEVWQDRPTYTGMARAKDTKGGFDDKAVNKCHTTARKYFLLGLFQIPTGDYPEADGDEAPKPAPAARNGTAKPATTARRAEPPPRANAAFDPAPLHDPVTGEVLDEPVAIGIPLAEDGANSDWRKWANALCDVSKREDLKLHDQWVAANKDGLAGLKRNDPTLHGMVEQRLAKIRKFLEQEEMAGV